MQFVAPVIQNGQFVAREQSPIFLSATDVYLAFCLLVTMKPNLALSLILLHQLPRIKPNAKTFRAATSNLWPNISIESVRSFLAAIRLIFKCKIQRYQYLCAIKLCKIVHSRVSFVSRVVLASEEKFTGVRFYFIVALIGPSADTFDTFSSINAFHKPYDLP